MKRIFILLFAAVLTASAYAVPVERVHKTITLANGKQVEVVMQGDEDYTYMMTKDGYIVDEEEAGYVLRSISQSSTLKRRASALKAAPKRSTGSNATAALKATGSPEIAVILAEFSDKTFNASLTTSDPISHFQLFYQGNGYDDNRLTSVANCRGAVREYFRDQSQGKFKPNFTVIGKYTVSYTHDHYYNQSAVFRNEVLQKATQDTSVDWTKFDSDGDGKVDGVIIVFAGAGNNTDSGKKHLHPCTWSSTTTINGVSFATQIIDSELRATGANYYANSIGVVCHEMGHMLGLPDMYQTNASSYTAPGMDVWDIMDYGEYVSSGTYPPGYSAYEKEFMGWITIPEIESGDYTLESLQEGGTAYRVRNPGNSNEYYLLEVRNSKTCDGGYHNWDYLLFCQSKGYYVGGCPGLLVTHYDYDVSAWTSNTVNSNVNHPRITIIPANGHFEILENLVREDATGQKWFNELKGHTYPCKNATDWGVLGNNQLSDTSSPADALFTANTDGTYYMHNDIFGITQDADEHISFHFAQGGDLTGTYYINVDGNGFMSRGADWGTRATVDAYGMPVEVKKTDDGYTLHYIDNVSTRYLGDSGTDPYTDILERTKKIYWELVSNGNGGYLLKNSSSSKYFKAGEALGAGAVFTEDEAEASVIRLYTVEQYEQAVPTGQELMSKTEGATELDMSEALTNPTMASGVDGWTASFTKSVTNSSGVNEVYEGYGSLSQHVTGLMPGIYRFTIPAFWRNGTSSNCRTYAEAGYYMSNAKIAVNTSSTRVASWESQSGEGTYPNTMAEAAASFQEGKYMNEVYAEVGEDGVLDITITQPNSLSYGWIIWGASTLTYYATESSLEVYRQYVQNKISVVASYIEQKTILPESYKSDIETLSAAAQTATTVAQLKEIYAKVNTLYEQAKSYRKEIERHDDCNSYLFVYFPSNSDENLYYAIGSDGFNYTPLNQGNCIMSSDSVAIKGGIRDPHILRGVDGNTFYMVATDMKCSQGWDSNRGIVMYKSTDLIHWTHSTVNFPTRFPEWANVTRVWAPETIWDPNYDNGEGMEKGRYMIYYSLLTNDGKCTYDKVYYSYANDDFTDLLTDPVYLYDRGSATIDADIVYDDCEGEYHMIYKNEGTGGICQVTAFSLTAPEGKEGTQWGNPSGRLEQTNVAVEGGGLFRLIDTNNWVMMYDCYTSGKYQFCETNDWQNFTLKAETTMWGKFTPRHGTVIALHPEETAALRAAFPIEGVKGDVNGDGVVDIADVNTILTVMFDGASILEADVNCDGVVDIADVNAVLSIMFAE